MRISSARANSCPCAECAIKAESPRSEELRLFDVFGDKSSPRPKREVRVGPFDQHTDAISKASEVGNVHGEPEPPRELSRHGEPAEVRHGTATADHRKAPLVAVLERRARLPAQRSGDHRARVRAHLIGG